MLLHPLNIHSFKSVNVRLVGQSLSDFNFIVHIYYNIYLLIIPVLIMKYKYLSEPSNSKLRILLVNETLNLYLVIHKFIFI